AWHFPNRSEGSTQAAPPERPQPACSPNTGCCGGEDVPAWHTWYATQWTDAADVARYVRDHYASLRGRTVAFQQALASSSLPAEVLDAVSANHSSLMFATVLRRSGGFIWAWEGCFPDAGCGPGICTHVWNYAQAMPLLFPARERTLRE